MRSDQRLGLWLVSASLPGFCGSPDLSSWASPVELAGRLAPPASWTGAALALPRPALGAARLARRRQDPFHARVLEELPAPDRPAIHATVRRAPPAPGGLAVTQPPSARRRRPCLCPRRQRPDMTSVSSATWPPACSVPGRRAFTPVSAGARRSVRRPAPRCGGVSYHCRLSAVEATAEAGASTACGRPLGRQHQLARRRTPSSGRALRRTCRPSCASSARCSWASPGGWRRVVRPTPRAR